MLAPYFQHQLAPYQYGFPSIPQPGPIRTSYNQPGTSSVTTGPGQPQPGLLQQYGPNVASAALRRAMAPAQSTIQWNGPRVTPIEWNSGRTTGTMLGDDYGLMGSQSPQIVWNDAATNGAMLGDDYGLMGAAAGPDASAAALEAADMESPYAAANLAASGGDAGLLSDLAAGSAYSTPAESGLLAADAAGTGAAATDAGLLGAGAAGGAAAGGEAAAAGAGAAAAEGTAAAVGASNFWNPVGWAALAGLAAYEMGLFD